MPTLPITDGHGRVLKSADGIIWSTMLYPRSNEDRENFRNAQLTRWIKEGPCVPRWGETIEQARINFQIDTGKWVDQAKIDLFDLSFPAPDNAAIMERLGIGALAGLVFLDLIAIGEVDPAQASVRKVADVRSRRGWGRFGGKTKIKEANAAFSPVRHLWGAALLLREFGLPDFLKDKENQVWGDPVVDMKLVLALLIFAEYLRSTSMRYLKQPFGVTENSDWILPRDLDLSDTTPLLSSGVLIGKPRPDYIESLKHVKG
jgi:hypothetical protein